MPDTAPPSPIPAAPGRPGPGLIALCLLLAALVCIFSFASGSNRSELGAHPDEAAHFVTGLMVHDYLSSGLHENPLHFADQYYRHYPKIGLGIWPPFFYLVQSTWALWFPVTLQSVLHLMVVLEMALALVTAWWLWRTFGWVEAVTGSVLLVALPLIQQYSNMVMAEILSALLMFAAAGYFARYLEGAEWRGALGFGITAGLAIMTKGTGIALIFVPALAILFTGRWDLFRRRSFWVSALIVVVIAGPWTWHFRNQGRGGWEEPSPSPHFTKMAVSYYGRELIVATGALLAALAVGGAISLFAGKEGKRPIVACSLALVLGVWFFQCLAPVGLEARHLVPTMPAMIVLAMAGLHWMMKRYPRRRPAAAAVLLAIFLAWPAIVHPPAPAPGYGSIGNAVSFSPFRIPKKQWGGFEPIAEAAVARGAKMPILVDSDSRGEGMFIADVAALDTHRPNFVVQRASKILALSTWSGSGYESFYTTPEQVRNAVQRAGARLIVTDTSMPAPRPHDKLLMQAISGGGFITVETSTAIRDGAESPGAIELHSAVLK